MNKINLQQKILFRRIGKIIIKKKNELIIHEECLSELQDIIDNCCSNKKSYGLVLFEIKQNKVK